MTPIVGENGVILQWDASESFSDEGVIIGKMISDPVGRVEIKDYYTHSFGWREIAQRVGQVNPIELHVYIEVSSDIGEATPAMSRHTYTFALDRDDPTHNTFIVIMTDDLSDDAKRYVLKK